MKKIASYVTGVNLIIFLVVVNILMAAVNLPQIDLTKDKVHSLSGTTKSTLRNLDDVVNVKVYLTKDLPSDVQPVAGDLQLILASMSNINSNKFKVTYYDPNTDSSAKTDADKYGITPLQFSSIQNDKFEVQNAYFGLVMQYGSKQEVIPVAGDVGNLEYTVLSSIIKLTSKSLPTVLVYEDSDTPQGSIQLLKQYLNQNYQVISANLNDDNFLLPDSASSMVIVGRRTKFGDKTIAKIQNWLNEGKGLVLMQEKVDVNGNMQAKKLDDTGLEMMLAQKGISIEPKLVVDPSSAIANFQTQNGSFLTKYPYWPQVRPENINSAIPALSGINSLTMAWPSPIDVSGKTQILFSSSNQSQLDDNFSDLTPQNKTFSGRGQKYALAVMNTDGDKLVVISDADFIRDQFVVNNQQNLLTVLNLIDYVSSGSNLMQIRSKVLKSSPIAQVNDTIKGTIRYGSLAAPVIILVITFAFVYGLQKRKNKRWLQELD